LEGDIVLGGFLIMLRRKMFCESTEERIFVFVLGLSFIFDLETQIIVYSDALILVKPWLVIHYEYKI